MKQQQQYLPGVFDPDPWDRVVRVVKDDPCRRGRDNAAEVHHETKGHHSITREMILTLVRGQGRYGMTLDEAAAFFGVAANEISGRFTELKKGEEIFETDRKRLTRKGCPAVVLVAGRFGE